MSLSPSMSISQWLLLFVLSVLWGGAFFFIAIAVPELPPLTIVLVRVALAALLLLPFVLSAGHQLPRGLKAWSPFLIMSVLNNVVPFVLITTGQKQVASGLASVINATTPLFALIVAHVLTVDEKIRSNRLAGVILGMVGLAILIGPEALVGRASSVVGMVFCLGAAFSYGLAAYWGRHMRQTPPLVSACCQLVGSTLILGVLAMAFDQPWTLPMPSPHVIAALVALAALSTSLAYVIFFRILAVSGGSNVALVTLLIPISAMTLGVTVLGETLHARQFAGACVIGVGLILIDGRAVTFLNQWLRLRSGRNALAKDRERL
jgi:drug/metabolite transporter (DMT)-like permease